ncbi:MAG: glycosyltransferase, partial [Planctomycetota bacterium]
KPASHDTGPVDAASNRKPFRKLSVLMPVFNERWTLPEIVDRVLNSPIDLDIELLIVDDASTDGSFDVAREMAEGDPRIRVIRHEQNRGKGAAIRTAIDHMTGDIAIVQDADLEYDPADFPKLLAPILDGRADAVFGSRFVGHPRRVLFFWHALVNRFLTLVSNMLNDLNLTDMETCYKAVRADVLKSLRLQSNTFTFEPELTCRLAQFGARIYEVPVSYAGRTYQEGKKIKAIDGLKALWAMFYYRFVDTRFTHHTGFRILRSVAKAGGYNRWILSQVQEYLGDRLLEAGSGIGNLSTAFLNKSRVVLADYEPMYVEFLKRRFGRRRNVRVDRVDLTNPHDFERWSREQLDTVFCSNVLEHLEPDVDVLRSFHQTLVDGGHCVIVVPAGKKLFTVLDRALGHHRRYTEAELRRKMEAAGFDVVFARRFNKLGAIAWAVSGHLLRRDQLSPRQMIWFDRLLPIVKLLDRILPVPGMSLIMVGRKRKAAAVRKAA